jgi:tetratricopeptide (TPR) repeat protein
MAFQDYKTALAVFERLLSSHQNGIKLEWKENIIQAYLAIDQPLRALPFIEELSIKFTGNKKKQWQEVRLYQYLNLNMKQRALEYAGQLTREYPVEPKWWKALAHIHLAENRYEKGLVALTVYSHLNPLTFEEKKLMAELNQAIGIPVKAARFYEDIISKKMDLNILKKLAETYLYLHQNDEALNWVEKGLQKNIDDELLMLKGNLLYEKKQYDAAMEVFESISGGKNSGQALLMLGYSAWNAGDLPKAKQAFKKATKYSKHKETARKLLQQLERTGT